MDFSNLNGEQFESLIEEVLIAKGFTVTSRPARGPDQGCDIIVERYVTDDMGLSQQEVWLVQCKNNSVSGKSVRESDIGNFYLKMQQHRANRFLLATTTTPAETVKSQFKALNEDSSLNRKAIFWNYQDLIIILDKFEEIRNRYQYWDAEAENLCELITSDHKLFSYHRGVMPWGDKKTAIYGNDGYDPNPGEPINEFTRRTRRQVEILIKLVKQEDLQTLAFGKSKSGATWVVLVNSNDQVKLSEMLNSAFWAAYEEQIGQKNSVERE
ncbi:restriction endonuclease [Pseudomonas helvetica]|uniref:restriction endonuclease n=1 Tax=Pseudomonas helvetica TaxID=3136738 RepID=UPI003265AEBF